MNKKNINGILKKNLKEGYHDKVKQCYGMKIKEYEEAAIARDKTNLQKNNN
jgi:hypothetical protein